MLVIAFFALAAYIFFRQIGDLAAPKAAPRVLPSRTPTVRLTQALDYANRLFSEKKYLLAEKAFLQVLKIDHKNVAAYTQLGMVYSNLSNYEDAKECFNIASQIDPSASTFHNLGLVYLESRNPIKAIAAFQKALIFESTASRHIDLAKAYQKLSNTAKVVSCLETAVNLEPTKTNLWLLAGAYKTAKNLTGAATIYRRILELDPTDQKASAALKTTPVLP